MKKVINKYRNSNGNNPQYSLNYKFDSISSAGKVSGTALELIKKYNELAKEASSNGNYTEMENFRQYAEHYRKIVTDINEKKNMMKSVPESRLQEDKEVEKTSEKTETPVNEVKTAENQAEIKAEEPTRKISLTKKEFKVVEIKQEKPAESSEKSSPESEEKTTKKRVVRKKMKETAEGE